MENLRLRLITFHQNPGIYFIMQSRLYYLQHTRSPVDDMQHGDGGGGEDKNKVDVEPSRLSLDETWSRIIHGSSW